MPDAKALRSTASRRQFIRAGVATAAVVTSPYAGLTGALTAPAPSAAPGGADDQPLMIARGAVQLFVDLDRVESMQNVRRTFHTAEKHPENPVIRRVRPWEDDRSTWGSVVYDEQQKIFRAWYGGKSGQQKEYRPGSLSDCSVLCYATSTDGIHWDRPDLGLHEVLGTKHNNVVIGDDHQNGLAHWESLLIDPLEQDSQRRYKAIGWSSNDWDGPMSGIYTMTSPDGLHWTHTPEPVFHYHPRPGTSDRGPVGDAQSMMIDTLRNRYVAFLRRIPGRAFSVSQDFATWTPPEVSLEARGDETGNTIYNHMGFVYGDRYLGQLTYLDQKDHTKTLVNVWLLTSRDGEHWDRPETERPLIDVGDIGEWDRFNIRLTGAPPIRVGDKLFIYYRNTANRHGPYVGTDTTNVGGGIGLATLRADGFASVAAGYDGGQLTTKPFRFQGENLRVNVKSDYGRLWVEVLDERGEPCPGFARSDCLPVSVDSVDHRIMWRDTPLIDPLSDRPIRLRFHLENVRLYSWWIA